MKLGCETALSHDEHSAAHPKQALGAICYPLLGIIRRDAAHYAILLGLTPSARATFESQASAH